jgi:N-acetylmuramoyl-L-alanine amidase
MCNLYQSFFFKTSFFQKNNISTSDDLFGKKLNRQKKQNASHFIKTIVLDPGHGGDEVGAKGPTSLLEKDVVLDICRILKNILTQKLNVKVYLTRNNDVYIPLEHRIEKANNYKADLFISIHTNASKRRAAKGAESYFLSYEALDKETKELAEFENQGMTAESITPNYDKKLELVLWHMAQAEYLAESSKLAELIQQELNDFLSVEERGIKQAPFLVLMGAQMPAVLVEVAFITNPYEEKMLKSYAFKEKIAQALYQGIANYIQLYNARMSGAAENEN